MQRLNLMQGNSRHLTHHLSDITMNHQFSLLFKASSRLSKVSLSFKMTRSIRQKHLCPPQCVTAHCYCDNRNAVGNALEGTNTLPLVLTWLQEIFICIVHSKGPRR